MPLAAWLDEVDTSTAACGETPCFSAVTGISARQKLVGVQVPTGTALQTWACRLPASYLFLLNKAGPDFVQNPICPGLLRSRLRSPINHQERCMGLKEESVEVQYQQNRTANITQYQQNRTANITAR